ncbi:hypothetical protein Ccrd_008862, partial [Cynara cardunculus var. scolymus]
YQLSLSEIGLTTDSSHSTWFHKTTRFSRSKSSKFYMKKIWLSVFYSIRIEEEPDPNQVKMRRINPFFTSKILPFPTELNFDKKISRPVAN